MKKNYIIPMLLSMVALILECLPYGAVVRFSRGTETGGAIIRETYSYFSLVPYGYANVGPFLTAVLTSVLFVLALIYLFAKSDKVIKIIRILSIAAVVTSLMPLLFGFEYFSIVGALITLTLIVLGCYARGRELNTD